MARSYFKVFHTTPERRDWYSYLDIAREFPQLPVRRRRCAANLPNTWDELPWGRSSRRSWKRYRRTQYRAT